MKRVPSSSKGASRRAYQFGYSKSATNKVADTLGSRKLSTPAFRPGRKPKMSTRDYSKTAPEIEVSFGATGLSDADFYE